MLSSSQVLNLWKQTLFSNLYTFQYFNFFYFFAVHPPLYQITSLFHVSPALIFYTLNDLTLLNPSPLSSSLLSSSSGNCLHSSPPASTLLSSSSGNWPLSSPFLSPDSPLLSSTGKLASLFTLLSDCLSSVLR